MPFTDLFFASLPFAYFLLISSVTPGPNNLMLAASGMNFGVRRTVPHMAGVATGFLILMFLCAFGIGALYNAYPQAHTVLNIFCAAYILYLSYKIATAGKPEAKGSDSTAKPMTFIQAALFQFINPKGWVSALASTSALLPPEASIFQKSLVIFCIVLFIGVPSICIWTLFGTAIARIFTSEKSHHVINIILALLLAATIPMMMI